MNLRPRTVNFDDLWPKLKETAEAIISLRPIERITWDHNFSDIYFACVSVPESQTRRLYISIRNCLELHTREIREQMNVQTGDLLLSAYYREWCKYRQGADFLHKLYGYLNKQLAKEKLDAESHYTFIADDAEGPFQHLSIGDLAFSIWKTELINPLASQLVTHIIDLIDKIRMGETSSALNADIRGAVHSFVEVNQMFNQEMFSGQQKSPYTIPGGAIETEFYEEIFERPFLDATECYYRLLTSESYAHLDCCPYMESVIQKMDEERNISHLLLHHSTLPKIEQLCSEVLVSDQLEKITTRCREIVQQEMIHDLKNIYILLKPLANAIPILMNEFELYVRKSGMEFTASTMNDPAHFVASITNLHEKFTHIINSIFGGDGEFIASLDRAIQSVVNHRDDQKQPPKISERLNRYIDSLMRAKKGKTEQEIEGLLSKSIVIFRYIDDKDLFQKYYSKMLCARLIGSLMSSMDLEESMINKMKEACGYEFTSKLSRMFTDINISQGLTKRFHEDIAKNDQKIDVPIHVMVLQAGAWPLTAPSTMSETSTSSGHPEATDDYVPPPILQKSLKMFEEFYTTSHSGRKLTWLYSNSTAEVQLNYLDRPYQAAMGIYQLSILLLFSNQDSQDISQFIHQCSLPLQIVLRATKGLIETGILACSDRELNESSVLKLNTSLTAKRLNLKVSLPQSNKPQEKEDGQSTCNTLQQDRKYYMECAIVRIMKARKVMKHNALVDEVINQTRSRFMPDIAFIKKNIEALIDKLYIQRTDQNDEYEYIS